jgi:hypothetical protein
VRLKRVYCVYYGKDGETERERPLIDSSHVDGGLVDAQPYVGRARRTQTNSWGVKLQANNLFLLRRPLMLMVVKMAFQ